MKSKTEGKSTENELKHFTEYGHKVQAQRNKMSSFTKFYHVIMHATFSPPLNVIKHDRFTHFAKPPPSPWMITIYLDNPLHSNTLQAYQICISTPQLFYDYSTITMLTLIAFEFFRQHISVQFINVSLISVIQFICNQV